MTQHAPKVAALLALEEGVLSDSAQARLHRHLEGCQVCRETQQMIRGYARISGEVQALETPTMDWDRIQPSAQRAASKPARARALRHQRWLGWAMAAAVAVSVGVTGAYLQRGDGGQPAGARSAQTRAPQPSSSAAAKAPQAVPEPQAAWLVLAGDDTTWQAPDHEPQPTNLLERLDEGGHLRVGPAGRLDLALESGAVVSLRSVDEETDAELVLERLRQEVVRLRLLRGALSQRVPPLAPGQRYEVITAAHVVHVVGTYFTVETDGGYTGVRLYEGALSVTHPDGAPLASLRAPASWRSETAEQSALAADRDDSQAADSPLAFHPPDDVLSLALPSLSNVRNWQVARAQVPGTLAWRVGVAQGTQNLTATLNDGTVVPVSLTRLAEGLTLSEATLAELLRPRTRAAAGSLAPAELMPVVQHAQPALQRCYERTLKRRPEVSLNVSLRVTLRPSGQVRRVELRGEQAVPSALTECVERVAKRWQFPSPGGALTFEAPLRFRPVY